MSWSNTTLALRVVLLAGGLLFIVALVWLDRRRRRQAGGDSLQAATPGTDHAERLEGTPDPSVRTDPGMSDLRATSAQRPLPVIDWQALERDSGQADGPTLAVHGQRPAAAAASEPEPEPDYAMDEARESPVVEAALPGITPYVGEPSIEHWPPDAARRICSLRIVPQGLERFSGRDVRQALQGAGFIHGPLGIYHHVDEQGRALISAANLARPGQLEPATLDFQRLGGLHLFTVLPGPLPDREALLQLFSLSAELAERVGGLLQDDRGGELDAARRQELLGRYGGAADASVHGDAEGEAVEAGHPAEPPAA